jgi:hypothetical protein
MTMSIQALTIALAVLGQTGLAVGAACSDDAGTCQNETQDEVSMLSHGTRQRIATHGFQCGALVCAAGSLCCDEAPAALCGSAKSTCCYNPGKTIANLCAPGSSCNTNTGNCFADTSFQCGNIACSEGSVCCDGAPAALCGGAGSTCCYNPGKTIANLCSPGSVCNAAGNCEAPAHSKICGSITCSEESVCCAEGFAPPLCGSPGSTCCYNKFKTVANLCSPGTACNEITGNCFA